MGGVPVRYLAGLPKPGRALVMGVLNVTPDSFSDGGRWLEPDRAIAHGHALLAEGADVVDVGGESTRPGAPRPTEEEELRRVLPVVRALASDGALVSIDTMFACARSDRTKCACSCPGRFQSDAYVPAPVMSRRSSRRDTCTPSTSNNSWCSMHTPDFGK